MRHYYLKIEFGYEAEDLVLGSNLHIDERKIEKEAVESEQTMDA